MVNSLRGLFLSSSTFHSDISCLLLLSSPTGSGIQSLYLFLVGEEKTLDSRFRGNDKREWTGKTIRDLAGYFLHQKTIEIAFLMRNKENTSAHSLNPSQRHIGL